MTNIGKPYEGKPHVRFDEEGLKFSALYSSGWLLRALTDMRPTTAAILAIDAGFLLIICLSFHHFRHKLPKASTTHFFEFLTYFKKYRSLFFIGCALYSGVYVHNFVYWFGPGGDEIANRYFVMPYYDLPVFFAYLSVLPTLVTFVVSVETSFYESFKKYYADILNGGTIRDIQRAKQKMQKTLVREISFVMEVQLVFTILAIALGIKFLPNIGFTMAQLDLFNILALAYFLFILFFVLCHILLYFDDRKGVLYLGALFFFLNIGLSYGMMRLELDGMGMFAASFLSLVAVIARLLHILRNIDYYTFCSQPLHVKEQARRTKNRSFFSKTRTTATLTLVAAITLSGCTNATEGRSIPAEILPEQSSLLNSSKLSEDKRIYERDTDHSLKTLYVTILPDYSSDAAPLTWYGLNRLPDYTSQGQLEVIVQEGKPDGEGPASGLFGYGEDRANGTITLRGKTAWGTPQKSYRIKLKDEAGTWLDQRTFNLNKHSLDLSRVRNKLSFDLLEEIDNITSLRTQFVRVYVKDQSERKEASFIDYGLYTHVEQPNKKFLQSHLLDSNGYLYKVTFFEFNRYPEQIRSQNDPKYDRSSFETILEIKGREDHDKLIRMLDDVNNYQISIDDIIAKHFDKENFLTWTAFNILTDNMDTDANNFYLYSPLNSETWYILPWDYDGGWELQRRQNTIHPHQAGISNYWGSILHNRYFRSAQHVEELKAKIEELSAIVNEQRIGKLLDSYSPVVKPYLFRNPDIQFLPGRNSDFEAELRILKKTPERAVQRFLDDLEKPKPFYQDVVVVEDGKHIFQWGVSYDLQGDDLVYDVKVARDPQLSQIVASATGIQETRFEVNALQPGLYYWSVKVRDTQGHEQSSFDMYIDSDDNHYYGIREFEVY